jgi:transposase
MGTAEVSGGVEGAGDAVGGGGAAGSGNGAGSIRRVATKMGVHPEALRTWVRQAEIDEGDRPGTTGDAAQRRR